MWDTQFETSMLSQGVVIHCPNEEAVAELAGLLLKHGVLAEKLVRLWKDYREETCYRISSGKYVTYSSKYHYEDAAARLYNDYTYCTYYGTNTANFDVATDDELLSFLGIGGD